METADMTPLLEQLEDDIDEVEDALEPLLSQALATTAQKMSVMDKAKLHVLITYTLESLLFSYLRLNGVNAKEHPVFKELSRVKQYFEKIKALETGPEKRTMTLDKDAAGRFIKHGLAGNDKADLARAEQEAKEKAMAQLRAAQLAKRKSSVPQKRTAGEEEDEAEEEKDDEDETGGDMDLEVEKMIRSEGAQVEPTKPDKTPEQSKKQRKREKKDQKKLHKGQKKQKSKKAKTKG